jgi:hypothetical protein
MERIEQANPWAIEPKVLASIQKVATARMSK